MINITLLKNGRPMRYVATRGSIHVLLAIVDDLRPGTGIKGAAGEGTGKLKVDVGITEVSTGG